MSTVNWSAIYLGNMSDLDTDESTLAGEGAAGLLTTFGSPGTPLSDSVVTLQTNSNDGNSDIGRDNDGTTDTIVYETAPGGPTQSSTLDSIYQVNISFDYVGGGGGGGGTYYIVQDDAGQLFLLAPDNAFSFGGAGSAPFESLTVNSIDADFQVLPQSSVDGGSFQSTSAGPTICFLPDTRIATPAGEVAAGNLRVGNLVSTLDHGAQPILWVGCRHMSFREGDDEFRPYQFNQGTLGSGLPKRTLKLSKQHRLLLHRGGVEHLGPAVGFLALRGVSRMNAITKATFMTFLLPHHDIIFAEGMPIESFYLGNNGLAVLSKEERSEIKKACERHASGRLPHRPARPFLSRKQTVDALRCANPGQLSACRATCDWKEGV